MASLSDFLGSYSGSQKLPEPTILNKNQALKLKNSQPKERFLYQIGEDVYWMEVWFWNGMKGYDPYPIPTSVIHQLVIEESLMNWFINGYIVLESQHESLFRGINEYERYMFAPMVLRSDARNKLSIKLYPYLENKSQSVSVDSKLWEMSFDCVIYDFQDSLSPDAVIRYKTLYFKDEKHQILLERNVEWSTSTDLNKKDSERTLKGTEAIASLIKTVGNTGGLGQIKSGYTEEGFINIPDIPFDWIDVERWDAGSETNKIFATSGARDNALQDLNELLQCTKASDGYPVILELGRHFNDRKWKLFSLSYFFKNASLNQIETLLINDGLEETVPKIPRAPMNSSSTSQNFISKVASQITNYDFVPMSPVDDATLINSPIYKFNFAKSQYEISMSSNTVESLRDKLKNLSKGLFSYDSNSNGQVVMNVNPTKRSGISTKPIFTPKLYTPSDWGSMSMLTNILFLGTTLYFEVMGLTFRTPGKFVNIDRMRYDDNPFDNRIMGQWLVTKVIHTFTKNSYINRVWCTRFDSSGVVLKEDISPF